MNPRKLRDHIEKLNVFVEVCRAQSFHKAARSLNVSQPSLSQAVKILEEILETRLFVRSQKGIQLTTAGQTLFYFSERLVSEFDGVENRLRSPDQPMIGSVTLGTYTTVTSYLLPKFLVYMGKKYPELSLGVVTMKSEELASALTTRRCHLVVGTVPFSQKTISQREIYKDGFGFFRQNSKDPSFSLKKAPMIFVGNAKDGRGNSLQQILNEAQIQGRHQYDVDNFESVRALISEGLGVGILPLRLAEAYVKNRQLIPVKMPKLGEKFGVHQFYASLLAQDLTDVRVSTVLGELADWCLKNLPVRS